MKNYNPDKPLTKEQLVEQFRRSEILKAARQIFGEQGYSRATIDMIAEQAGIAKGTIYLYFHHKEELFLHAIEERIKEMLKSTIEIMQEKGEPLEKIQKSIAYIFSFLDEDQNFYRIFNAAIMESRIKEFPNYIRNIMEYFRDYLDALTPTLKEAIDSGILIEMDPLKMAFLLGGIIDSIMHYRIMVDTTQPFSADDKLAYNIFLNGFLRKERENK